MQQAELSKQLGPDTPRTKELIGRLNQLKSDQAKMEFKFNNDKAVLGVMEVNLQDAITANNKDKIRELSKKIQGPRADLAAQTEAIARKKDEVAAAQKELSDHTAPLDAVTKRITKLQTAIEALRKKREALVPRGLISKVSEA